MPRHETRQTFPGPGPAEHRSCPADHGLAGLLRFVRAEDGAVTIDWTVLTASLVGLGLAGSAAVILGTGDLSGDVDAFLRDQEVSDGFRATLSRLISFDDFENGQAPGWSVPNIDATDPDFTAILGRFGGTGGQQMVHKTFDLDPEAGFAVLEFDMHAIDTWDMENMFVYLNDEVVSQRNFSTHGLDPGRQVAVNTDNPDIQVSYEVTRPAGEYGFWERGNTSSYDETVTVRMVVANPGDQIKLGFGSSLNQPVSDESWAIDNVRVTSTNDPEAAPNS